MGTKLTVLNGWGIRHTTVERKRAYSYAQDRIIPEATLHTLSYTKDGSHICCHNFESLEAAQRIMDTHIWAA